MTTYYVGPGGNDANSGLTWALRKLTLNGAEDVPVAAGDVVYVGPNVYRELLTIDVSGGNTYVVGTVDVTNGSTQVDGNGTFWLANVAADYMFHIIIYASAADGVANGTATFTSAAGNFQASMIGQDIQINTRGAYRIGAVAAANSITLTDPNGLGWPAAGGGLSYSVMSGQGHYEVDSVDDNVTIQLKQSWNGPTLTGISYLTFNPIRYIGDVTGENTDGIGGIVRITGSDNDQTATRANCISSLGPDYRTFRGFSFDTTTSYNADIVGCEDCLIEDCTFQGPDRGAYTLHFFGNATGYTVRRCIFLIGRFAGIYIRDGATVDDAGHLVENCTFISNLTRGIIIERIGGITVRNCICSGVGTAAVQINIALVVGQTTTVNNCVFYICVTALRATAVGEITEDFNTFWANGVDRNNVAVGASSIAYPPLFVPPILHAGASQISGFKFPWWFGELSEWSQIAAIAGSNEPSADLHGIARPVTANKNSWGPIQFQDIERETGTVHAGIASIKLADAGSFQMFVPLPAGKTTLNISAFVYREANYTGTNPQMILKQPGQADQTVTDATAAGQWNEINLVAAPVITGTDFVIIELRSNNTAGAGNYAVYFDDLIAV